MQNDGYLVDGRPVAQSQLKQPTTAYCDTGCVSFIKSIAYQLQCYKQNLA